MTDQRRDLIAKAFCHGHVPNPIGADSWGIWPCRTCRSRAQDALDALDQRPSLFDQVPAVQPLSDPRANRAVTNGTDTSRTAALAVLPRSGTQRWTILALFKNDADAADPGYTDEELAAYARLSPNTVRPRRGELVAGGWLRDSGRRRQTLGANPAIVWELTEAGREAIA